MPAAQKKPDIEIGLLDWWRRRDSLSASFDTGWTMPSSLPDAERIIRRLRRILVRALPWRFSASISLYRAGLELASFLPLGVAIPSRLRFRRCEPRFHSALSRKGDP